MSSYDRHQKPRSNGYSSYQSSSSSSNNNGYQRSSGSSSYSNGLNGSSNGGYKNKMDKKDELILRKPNWSTTSLRTFEKDLYREHPSVTNRPNAELIQFLNENNIVVTGDRFINPIFEFEEADFPEKITHKIRDFNFKKPTIIQSMCWPTLLSGCDIVGIARTGSGKTLGFVLPLLIHIRNSSNSSGHHNGNGYERSDRNGPVGLILAPTRELAQQIQDVAESFGSMIGVNTICVYGGSPKPPQLQQIRRGGEICIATPGRLLDFLKENQIKLTNCTYLVLDEADRMLDMGFEPQIRKIIEQIRPDRQTAMFSATWPKDVRKLAEDFLSNYIHITIGNSDLTANPNIKQIVEVCEDNDKNQRLTEILRHIMSSNDAKVIMFAETKRKVDNYSKFIRSLGHYCLTIHGDKKQSERDWVLNEFRGRKKSILVATDVAARGLNIEDVKYVINIDYPSQTEDYIHRIGRTARNTQTGTSYTFITSDNARQVPKLLELLRDTNQEISPDLLMLAESVRKPGRNDSRGYQRGGNSMHNRNTYSNTKYPTNGNHNDSFNNYRNDYSNGNGNSSSNGHQYNGNSKYSSASSSSYNKMNNENGNSYMINDNSRKRHASELESNNTNDCNSTNNNNGNTRIKKCRWDNPSYPPSNINTNGNGYNNLTSQHSLTTANQMSAQSILNYYQQQQQQQQQSKPIVNLSNMYYPILPPPPPPPSSTSSTTTLAQPPPPPPPSSSSQTSVVHQQQYQNWNY